MTKTICLLEIGQYPDGPGARFTANRPGDPVRRNFIIPLTGQELRELPFGPDEEVTLTLNKKEPEGAL